MNIILTKCSDITWFYDHIICPKCYGLLHANLNIIITICKSIICFDQSHQYCPDCYCILHVSNK
jgi:hypothetical protein